MGLFDGKAAKAAAEMAATLAAISKSQAVIEFTPDGTILTANENFCKTIGYTLDEIAGQHHRMFVEPAYAASADYKAFWERLGRGEFDAGEYKRIGKGGKEVWIQASYNPVFDARGKVLKIVKFAADVTAQKLEAANALGQLQAISRSQAVIEFNLKGEIITANENFCSALGYRLEEIKGKHHRMFVEPGFAASTEYQTFWEHLGRGEYQAAEYMRIGKGGKQIWIQATYNPIFDMNGRPFKLVKYATDITARKTSNNILGTALSRLAQGDLTARIETKFDGELELVRSAFNETLDRFSSIVAQLRATSNTLKQATGEILTGANDLADRTTKQAAAIEETSAAMEQLAGTVEENAKRAESANVKAKQVAGTAEQAGEVMRKSNEAMERISTSSSKISNIIGLIDDIAFQTNLLALNASVEAARAGDAGKGFAVVAVEVRRLAQSAANASSEVKVLIEQSGSEVTSGGQLVAEATAKLDAMLVGIRESAQLTDGIAQATREQSGSIAEVSTAIRQMDEMTQHNATLVQQTNASVERTEGQASELDRIVEVFVLDDAAATRVQRPPLSPAPQSSPSRARSGSYASHGNAAIKQDWSEF